MPTLREIAGRIDEFGSDEELVIFVPAATEIDPDAEVTLAKDRDYPDGLVYLLEAFIAAEVVEDWEGRFGPISPDERARLIAHYAEHDAYPETLT